MGGIMTEHKCPFDPSNDQPHISDNQHHSDAAADEPIRGLDVHDDLVCPLSQLQQPPRGRCHVRVSA
jgi:hypothetical protein